MPYRHKGAILTPVVRIDSHHIDYEETFSPVAWYTSIRAIMALASMMKWDLHQMDVKTTFMNGVIEEVVYIE